MGWRPWWPSRSWWPAPAPPCTPRWTRPCWQTSSTTWTSTTASSTWITTTTTWRNPQYNAMDNMDMYDDQPIDINDMPIVNKIAPDPPKVPAKNSMLPAYCDPPNPCPHGYTSQDGCLEVFENT